MVIILVCRITHGNYSNVCQFEIVSLLLTRCQDSYSTLRWTGEEEEEGSEQSVETVDDSLSVLFEVDDHFCVVDQLQGYAAGVVGTEGEDVG